MLKGLIALGIGVSPLGYGLLNGLRHSCKVNLAPPKSLSPEEMRQFESNLKEFCMKTPHCDPHISKIPERNKMIEKLKSEKFDILVIGGGCNGAGVLLDGHLKNFKCGLIECNDFASGISSRSTKLIHGGLRYLQDVFKYNTISRREKLHLVVEALRERDFLLNCVPFMTNPVEITIPSKSYSDMCYYYLGVLIYHLLYYFKTKSPSLSSPYFSPRDKTVSYYEGQMFDARQCVLSILTTCTTQTNNTPSVVGNYIEFKEYVRDNSGKIIGVKAYDKINKESFVIYSECVVNCGGIYCDTNLSREDPLRNKLIKTSKGVHVIMKREMFEKVGIKSAYMIPKTSDGRVLFIMPYQKDFFLVGTSDNKMNKTDYIPVSEQDVNYIIQELKLYFKISEEEVKSAITSKWAGLRAMVFQPTPGKENETVDTKNIARNHVIRVDPQTKLVSLLGGKWTTFRRMGVDVIDKITTVFPKFNKLRLNTGNYLVKLHGGIHQENFNKVSLSHHEEKNFYNKLIQYILMKYNYTDVDLIDSLIYRYGMNALQIMEIDKKIPADDKFICKGILKAELLFGMKNELVMKPNDFLCRRNGIAFVDIKKSEEILSKVADIMGTELKWSEVHLKNEIETARKNLQYMV